MAEANLELGKRSKKRKEKKKTLSPCAPAPPPHLLERLGPSLRLHHHRVFVALSPSRHLVVLTAKLSSPRLNASCELPPRHTPLRPANTATAAVRSLPPLPPQPLAPFTPSSGCQRRLLPSDHSTRTTLPRLTNTSLAPPVPPPTLSAPPPTCARPATCSPVLSLRHQSAPSSPTHSPTHSFGKTSS